MTYEVSTPSGKSISLLVAWPGSPHFQPTHCFQDHEPGNVSKPSFCLAVCNKLCTFIKTGSASQRNTTFEYPRNCKIFINSRHMKCTSLLNGTGIAKTHPEWLSYTFNTVCLSSGATTLPKQGKTDGPLPVNEKSKLNTECSRRVKCSGSDVWGSGLPFAITHDSHQLAYGRWYTSCKARSSGEGSACKGCCFGIGCPKGSACSVANSWRTCKRNLSACVYQTIKQFKFGPSLAYTQVVTSSTWVWKSWFCFRLAIDIPTCAGLSSHAKPQTFSRNNISTQNCESFFVPFHECR